MRDVLSYTMRDEDSITREVKKIQVFSSRAYPSIVQL